MQTQLTISRFRILPLLLCLFSILATQLSAYAMAPRQPLESPPDLSLTPQENNTNGSQLTYEELRPTVMSFADRFAATIGQAAIDFENAVDTTEVRLMAARRKVYSLTAAFEIAAGPNPAAALLDMVVLVTLNRIIWEEYWQPKVFGPSAKVMTEAFKRLETDIWHHIARLLTPAQQDELRSLIQEWRISNPTQYAVDYIRFSDFGDLGTKPALEKVKLPGGLLAPVKQATQAVDEVRITSERAMFLFTRLLLLAQFHAELMYKELVRQPEVSQLLTNTENLKGLGERYADLVEQLPAELASQTQATVDGILQGVSQEREATIAQAMTELAKEREAALTQALDGISKERQDAIEQLMQALAIERQAAIAQALDGVATETKDIVKEVTRLIEQREKQVDAWILRIFIMVVLFVLVLFMILFVYRYVSARLIDTPRMPK